MATTTIIAMAKSRWRWRGCGGSCLNLSQLIDAVAPRPPAVLRLNCGDFIIAWVATLRSCNLCVFARSAEGVTAPAELAFVLQSHVIETSASRLACGNGYFVASLKLPDFEVVVAVINVATNPLWEISRWWL
jgi:hypothetical protein